MELDRKALAVAGSLLTAGAILFFGVLNMIVPGYAGSLLELAASIYPGYGGAGGLGDLLVGTAYGLVDGAVGGWLLAWLYNAALSSAG